MTKFYLPRTLHNADNSQKFTDLELLSENKKVIVVLAEPGAGKSDLLDSLAKQSNVTRYKANIFAHSPHQENHTVLIIDGFDELVKIDDSVVIKTLITIKQTSAEKIILSSRSSEWSNYYNTNCQDIFNEEPLLVYLEPFDEQEQAQLFSHYYPTYNAERFLIDSRKIELTPLLSNPLFLKLFAKSYVENNQNFENKYSAFKIAIEGLAKESNNAYRHSLSIPKKIELAEDIFAKIMLSGAEGISITDDSSNNFYPHLTALNSDENINQLISTQFFIPENQEQHRPIHRIVAEYCAGSYLAKKLTALQHPLSLNKILSIIVPNNIVRDELRGLFAWIAILSNNHRIQEQFIDLDPYAILSNGDPSLLLSSSKIKLLNALKQLNQKDPYFRRSDVWRNFSVNDFFTEDLIDELKELLSEKHREGHLQRMLLELLIDSPINQKITNELKAIICDTRPKYKEWGIRRLAGQCLLSVKDYPFKSLFDVLIEEGDNTSLSIISDIMLGVKDSYFEFDDYVKFLQVCSELYPKKYGRERVIGTRYFITVFIDQLDLDLTIKLLDELSKNLSCVCKNEYDCQCRIGMSKIIVRLLDRYFELYNKPYNSVQIWQWVKNLYFKSNVSKDISLSVKIFSENHELRRSIIKIAMENLSDIEKIRKIVFHNFSFRGHSGLRLQYDDYWYIVNLAFDTNNTALWKYFTQRHNYENKESNPNLLRRHMRLQAMQKSEFLRIWYQELKKDKTYHQEQKKDYKYDRYIKRQDKKQQEIYQKNLKYIAENRALIESGCHWQSLFEFAYTVLQEPESIVEKFGDEKLVRNALYNCLDFIKPDIPNLPELVELQCQSRSLEVEVILYASCLEILKRDGSLKRVPKNLLEALCTNLSMHWRGLNSDEHSLFKKEVYKCLFDNLEQKEQFLRAYIEPQISCVDCSSPQIYWLDEEEYKPLARKLSLEWLIRFPNMQFNAQKELFLQSIKFGDLDKLKEFIKSKGGEFLKQSTIPKEDNTYKERQDFWLVHAFYLLDEDYEIYWNKLIQDINSILILNRHLGAFGDYRDWLTLSSQKIELILSSFIDKNLPNNPDSLDNEKTDEFLGNIIFMLGKQPSDNPLPVIDRLLNNPIYQDLHTSLKSIRFDYLKKSAMENFKAPTPENIVNLLEKDDIVSSENLRAVILEELELYQNDLNGHDTTTKSIFYHGEQRVDENTASQYIAERLRLRLEHRQVLLDIERYMHNQKRCDIVCSKIINGKRKIVPIEVKGQWHPEVYSAFDNQLNKLYTIHPDSEGQGVYLVLWFGKDEKVANRKGHCIQNAEELYQKIQENLSEELRKRIDIFVIDLSYI
ncbi:NACHT domain-containing protein [Moraxella equi]|uniref:NACHT domain n=1 Tax=Moraxella equi TaxID=60442 RepID=A0A378QN48_9GAMM|nr:NACHT domain-containing protein [Moraxella equi]OPH37935.1 hypothetical protein B5J93_07370 [Moraxella equi]STZ02275.1 NACHT domain [Moraxella equi]